MLLFATWALAEVNLGSLNNVVALGLAVTKMLLVHVKYAETRLTWIFVAAGFIWFVIMVTYSIGDYLTRGPSWH